MGVTRGKGKNIPLYEGDFSSLHSIQPRSLQSDCKPVQVRIVLLEATHTHKLERKTLGRISYFFVWCLFYVRTEVNLKITLNGFEVFRRAAKTLFQKQLRQSAASVSKLSTAAHFCQWCGQKGMFSVYLPRRKCLQSIWTSRGWGFLANVA